MHSLRHIVIEHLFSIGIVALVVAGILLLLRDSHGLPPEEERAHRFLQIDSVDYTSQLDRALFRDAYCDIAGASLAKADSVLGAIDRRRIEEFTNPELKQGGERKTLTWETAAEILPIIEQHNREGRFPLQLVPKMAELGASIPTTWEEFLS